MRALALSFAGRELEGFRAAVRLARSDNPNSRVVGEGLVNLYGVIARLRCELDARRAERDEALLEAEEYRARLDRRLGEAATERAAAVRTAEERTIQRCAETACPLCRGTNPHVSAVPSMDESLLGHHWMDSGEWASRCLAAEIYGLRAVTA